MKSSVSGGVEATADSTNAWSRAVNFVGVIVFFHITCIGWLMFRAGAVPPEISQRGIISSYLETLWKIPAHWSGFAWPVLFLGSLALLLQWQHALMDRFSEWTCNTQAVAVTTALTLIAALGVFEGSSFIYFQF